MLVKVSLESGEFIHIGKGIWSNMKARAFDQDHELSVIAKLNNRGLLNFKPVDDYYNQIVAELIDDLME